MTNCWPKTRYKPQLVGISETHWAKSQCKKKNAGVLLIQDCPVKLLCSSVASESTVPAYWSSHGQQRMWWQDPLFNLEKKEKKAEWSITCQVCCVYNDLSHFTLDLHSGFPCKFLDHCWCEEMAFKTNSKLFVTLPCTGNWKGNFSVRSDHISNGKTSW